jgi:hypothetical protein
MPGRSGKEMMPVAIASALHHRLNIKYKTILISPPAAKCAGYDCLPE